MQPSRGDNQILNPERSGNAYVYRGRKNGVAWIEGLPDGDFQSNRRTKSSTQSGRSLSAIRGRGSVTLRFMT